MTVSLRCPLTRDAASAYTDRHVLQPDTGQIELQQPPVSCPVNVRQRVARRAALPA